MLSKRTKNLGERRYNHRYPISLDVQWRLLLRNVTADSGQGRTVDLSSGGILLETGRSLPVGQKVRLVIAWPALPNKISGAELLVSGRVVRSDGNRNAIRIDQHAFHTLTAAAAAGGGSAIEEPDPFPSEPESNS
jgi:c-di-GMP-binding flagellar brake protein YcgR